MMIVLLGWVPLLIWGCDGKKTTPADSPRSLSARSYSVEHLEGIVEFAVTPEGPWRTLASADTLKGGYCVRTSYDAMAVLKGSQGDRVILMELCRVVLDPEFLRRYAGQGEDVRGLQVLSGKAWLDIAKGKGTFLGATPAGLVRVKGTRFSLEFESETRAMKVALREGSVAVAKLDAPEETRDLVPGQVLVVSPGEPLPAPSLGDSAELSVPSLGLRSDRKGGDRESGTAHPGPGALGEGEARGKDPGPADGTASRMDAVEEDLERMGDSLRGGGVLQAERGSTVPDGQVKGAEAAHEAGKRAAQERMRDEREKAAAAIRKQLGESGGASREEKAFEELEAETGE